MIKNRFVGVDLCRAIAAFAVVVIHAGGELQYPDSINTFKVDSWLPGVVQVCRFAVPFFLAASFYFVVGKVLKAPERFDVKSFFWSRVTRLLVPYTLWSLIYLSVRGLKAVKSPEGLAPLFQDPIFLVFLGGAAIHLYFLPLLFTGSLLIPILEKFSVEIKPLWVSGLLLIGSLVLYEWIFVTGNSFDLGINCLNQPQVCAVAFQSLLQASRASNSATRLLGVELFWLIRCAMFMFASVLLHHPVIQKRLIEKQPSWVWGGVVGFATLGGALEHFQVCYFPLSLYELGVGYGLLLWGLARSQSLLPNAFWSRLGGFSFGIYLVHYLVLVLYSSALVKLFPALLAWPPTVLTLLLAIITFLTSWAIAFGLGQRPMLRRLLLSS